MTAQRMLFITMAALIIAGIFLTGLSQTHWLLMVVAALISFAAITGICPALKIYQKLGLK